jgi:hypothetical protein
MAIMYFVSRHSICVNAPKLTGTEKVHARLQGAELLALEADMRQNLAILAQMNHGKQVAAIHKLLYGSHGPPSASTSSRSPASASTNASTTSDGDVAANNHQESK